METLKALNLRNPLSPGWVHTITLTLGHSLKSEIGQKLQKWVLYNLIDDPIDVWLHCNHSDPDDIRMIENYVESNGSTVSLPNCTVKNSHHPMELHEPTCQSG